MYSGVTAVHKLLYVVSILYYSCNSSPVTLCMYCSSLHALYNFFLQNVYCIVLLYVGGNCLQRRIKQNNVSVVHDCSVSEVKIPYCTTVSVLYSTAENGLYFSAKC